jgi:hypothetical protein
LPLIATPKLEVMAISCGDQLIASSPMKLGILSAKAVASLPSQPDAMMRNPSPP